MLTDFYKAPPDYEAIRRAVYDLKGRYRGVRAFPIGKSVLGRGIFALAAGRASAPTLMIGGVHGLEWITTLLMFRFCEDLLYCTQKGEHLAGVDVKKGLASRGVVIVPCLNPDGVDIAINGASGALSMAEHVTRISKGDFSTWQANARGIDINHNFDAGWGILKKMETDSGITGPAPTRYGGERPGSEPETRAAMNVSTTFNVRQAYAFHSQGEEIYYKYEEKTPAQSQLMAEVLASSCGYSVTVPKGLASHGGFKDWFIEKLGRPGFTFEVGKGNNPLPADDLEDIYARLKEALVLAILI